MGIRLLPDFLFTLQPHTTTETLKIPMEISQELVSKYKLGISWWLLGGCHERDILVAESPGPHKRFVIVA